MNSKNVTDCPFYCISRATLVTTSALKKGLAAAGVGNVKTGYLGVLDILWQEDGIKAVELGRMAGLEPSSMTGLLDRMERDGLIRRKSAPNDRRALNICLTETGRKVQTPVLNVIDAIRDKVFGNLTEKEIETMKEILQKVLINTNEENN